jgi:hypothetical protein
MKYMMFIKGAESQRSLAVPPGIYEAMGEFVTEGLSSGLIKETAGLKATSEGQRVRISGGKLHVTDGPFTEAKEVVGGFAIVEVTSKAEALEVARKFMDIHRVHWPEFEGECELRQYEDNC